MGSSELIDVPSLAREPALAARLSAPAGPARPLLVRHADTRVLALPGRYCVVYVIVVDGKAIVVDVGSHEDLASVASGLAYLGVDKSDVRYVMATHLHFDHVMGLDAAAQAFGAPLALGRVSREAVKAGRPIRWPRRMGTIRAIPGWVMQGAPAIARTDRAGGLGFGFPWSSNRFSARLGPVLEHEQPLPGLDGWTVLETPGHSSDSICLHHAGAGILVAGDSVRNFRGGEWNGLLDDAERYEATKTLLRSLPVSVACPGHGPVLSGDGILSRMASVGFWGRRTLTGTTA
jgi:hydroxyacylglutathione hydrolase